MEKSVAIIQRITYSLAGQAIALRTSGRLLTETFDDNAVNWTEYPNESGGGFGGEWNVVAVDGSYAYRQQDADCTATNSATPLTQSGAMTFEWTTTFESGGRAAGMHFFGSEAGHFNHGNSYLVWQDGTNIHIYEAVNNVLYGRAYAPLPAANGQTYHFSVAYDPDTGLITVWRDGVGVLSWTDSSPLTNGSYLALRTNSSQVLFDDIQATAQDGVITYIHNDHLGSASVLQHSDGTVVNQARYYPFGEYYSTLGFSSGPNEITDRGFTGHRHNDGLGLIYMNARYYVKGIGRFASADTIVPNPTNPQSLNRYTYVLNSPIKFVDPSGHAAICGSTRSSCGGTPSPSGKYGYSNQYGWFDRSHVGVKIPNLILQNVGQAANLGEDVTFSVGREWQHGSIAYLEMTYTVNGDIIPDQVIGVALAIYMNYERQWETWQGDIGPGDSKFAIEDLPSDYVGFYAAVNNMDTDYALQQLGPFNWSDKGPPGPKIVTPMFFPLPWEFRRVENQNTKFSPKIMDGDGGFANISWPDSMQMTPINTPDLWRQDSGKSSGWWAGWFIWPWQPE